MGSSQNTAEILDQILKLCCWRFNNNYTEGQWEKFISDITKNSDPENSLFRYYLQELFDQKYIRIADDGYGYVATAKGLMFKGYVQAIKDNEDNSVKERRNKIIMRVIPIFSVCAGAILNHILSMPPQVEKTNSVYYSKNTTLHDTIYIDSSSVKPY